MRGSPLPNGTFSNGKTMVCLVLLVELLFRAELFKAPVTVSAIANQALGDLTLPTLQLKQ